MPNYLDYPSGNPIDNVEDYYIYFGSEANSGWVPGPGGTKCIEGWGIEGEEMEFYIFGMGNVVNDLASKPTSQGLNFEICINLSGHSFNPEKVWHKPNITFRYKHIAISQSNYPISIE